MELFFFAVLLGLIPAAIAQRKARSFMAWWVYGALLFIIALPHALLIRPNAQEIERRKIDGGDLCPHCAEPIKLEVNICNHCGREVPPLAHEIVRPAR
jgi:hypothetical protein